MRASLFITCFNDTLIPPLPFPEAARIALSDTQLRRNIGHATHTIRAKRAAVVAELPDGERLREAGRAIKERTLRHLDEYLLDLEESVTRAGGVVHWARDGEECNRIVGDLIVAHGATQVVKSKSLTTEETRLNEALQARGFHPWETDLAQLIIQLDDDMPSHILVPAIHKNRAQIRDLFRRTLPEAPPDSPMILASWPRPPAGTCAGCFSRPRWGSVAPTSRSRRRDRWRWSSPRATVACARRCPRC